MDEFADDWIMTAFNLVRRAEGNNLPLMHHCDAICDAESEVAIMRDDK
jgi:hypothetical protein